MNLVLATTFAFAAAVEGRLSAPFDLLGAAKQFSFLEKHSEGGQPDYCYPINEPADYDCYKAGYPKCCTKSKGNCPKNSTPECECLPGVCGNSDSGTRSERCVQGDGTCKGDDFCRAEDGVCGESSGRCEAMPNKCGYSYLPVCGCNGATYDNECLANAVGVSVDYDRPCGSPPAEVSDCTLDGYQCRYDEFCAAEEGQCLLKMAGTPGNCRPLRDACDMSYEPVCGCDGKTYDNANCAQAEGVNVASGGTCRSPPPEADDCVEMGDTAAELVVNSNWCSPGNAGTAFGFPDYVSQCKEVATNVCEGQIPSVARRWCPAERMTTTALLNLQRKCEDQVNSMLRGLKLA